MHVAFLFVDLEEMPPDGNGVDADFGAARALLRACAAQEGGRELLDAGDGLLFALDDPAAAARAARAIQEGAAALARSIRFRMALHWGTADLRDGRWQGPEVKRAASLLSAAHAGQALCSQAFARALAGDHQAWTIRQLGTFRLRGFPRAEPVFQFGVDAPFPPLKASHARRHFLPEAATVCVGRDAELAAIEALLDPGGQRGRIVTLSGPGGVGKTRLAIAAGWRLLQAFDRGVIFVPLGSVTSADLIFDQILAVVGLERRPREDPLETLGAHLGGAPTLLILDNLEPFRSGGAARIQRLVDALPGLRLLLTSRARLGLRGESEHPVLPLELPPDSGAPAAELSRYGAVRLFTNHAVAAQPAFAVQPRTADALTAVCRLLGGLPLALELAAARLRVLTMHELRAELRENFASFARESDPATSRGLAGVFDWTTRLLPAPTRSLLATASIFQGGWTAAAAAAIAEMPAAEALGRLHDLIASSLVRAEPQGNVMRFTMLEPLRQLAAAGLGASAWEIEARHSGYYRDLVRRAARMHGTPEEAAAAATLAPETANLLRALETAPTNQERVWAAIDLHEFAAHRPWNRTIRRHLTERRADAGELDPRTAAIAWNAAGMLDLICGEHGLAEDAYAEAMTRFRALGDRDSEMAARFNLAILAEQRGDLDVARSLQAECLTFFRDRGNRPATAGALIHLAAEARRAGRLAEAFAYLDEALPICRELGGATLLAEALAQRASAHWAAGTSAEVITDAGEALTLRLALAQEGRLRGLFALLAAALTTQRRSEAPFWLGAALAQSARPDEPDARLHAELLTVAEAALSNEAAWERCDRGRTADGSGWQAELGRLRSRDRGPGA